MTLVERQPTGSLLDGIVKCRNCGVPMETTVDSAGDESVYVCADPRGDCDTRDILAEPFNRLMVARVISTLLGGDNAKKVEEAVLEMAREEAEENYRQMFSIQYKLMGYPSDHESNEVSQTPQDEEEDPETVLQRNRRRDEEELAERSHRDSAYRRVMENPDWTGEYARNPETYLRAGNLTATRTILETAVLEILAGNGSATIRYRALAPSRHGTRTSEEVAY